MKRRSFLPGYLVALCVALTACVSTETTTAPDDQYGHRYEGVAPDGRETVLVTDADTTEEYLTAPAVIDSVNVRPAREVALPGADVAVEVLIKGALPDGCSELNEATQSRRGHLIDVELTVRRPRGAICIEVLRPFRFYLPLEGTFAPGSYSLKINGASHPFRIREAETGT
ncbi:MAG: hypothetical protein R3284_00490 [Rubricoccaceae bacterium]|nr:hypothetical protein [Rubricoccaceae bacterium]